MAKKLLALLMGISLMLSLCACAASPSSAGEVESAEAKTESSPEAAEPEAEQTPEATPSQTAQAEAELLAEAEYADTGFITEAEFYRLLSGILAVHDAEMTPYPGDSAYFYIDYDNVENVWLLTTSKTMEEIEADREAALNAKYSGEEPGEAEEETEDFVLDPDKDVTASGDYVTSFVLGAGTGEMDQQFMFLLGAAALCILDPHFNNTDDAFSYMWQSLYRLYGNRDGQSVSVIDGFDPSMSFQIPGNGAKLQLGTDDMGNYVLTITLYVEYDEIIDVANSIVQAMSIPGGS